MAKKADDVAGKAAAVLAQRAAKKKEKSKFGYYLAVGSFVAVTLFAVVASFGDGAKKPKGGSGPSVLDKEVNDYYFINDVTSRAGENFTAAACPFFKGWKLADMKYGFDGVTVSDMIGMPGAAKNCEYDESFESGNIPTAFDARTEWADCFTGIYDSGNCTSSYAIAAAASLSQRFCAADEEKYKKLRLSPQQVLSCDKKSRGCRAGVADAVWAYLQRRGLYPEECLPYTGAKVSECKTACDSSRKFKPISHCVTGGVKRIKREVLARGPVVVPMRLFTDFLVYKEGVYTPVSDAEYAFASSGKPILHAVTVLGWGKSKGTPYWLIENSWGTEWGEAGYARIAIGEALLEHYAIVGYPETAEALAKAEQDKQEAAERLAQAKRERAEREQRIAAAREAAAAAQQDEDVEDLDIDLDDESSDKAEGDEAELESDAL